MSVASLKEDYQYDGEPLDGESKIHHVSIEPSIGYFVSNNVAVEFTLDVESKEQDEYKQSSALIGPFIRLFIGQSNIKPYLQGDILFGSRIMDDGNDEFEFKTSGIDVGGGVAVFLNKRIALDFSIAYASITSTLEEDTKYKENITGFGLNAGILYFYRY